MNNRMATTTASNKYPSSTLLLLFLVLIIWLSNYPSPALSQEPRCHPEDQKALLQIKQELGNPSKLSSWDPTTSDCCFNWENVECTTSKPYRVRYLVLYGIDLSGPVNFPQSVTNLPYLDLLSFIDMPNLTGTIPPSITKLTKLDQFELFNTNVSGPIPNYLAQMKSLTALIFMNNNFSGPLPVSIPQLPNLVMVQMKGNRLTGPIPESYGSFTKNLTTLVLSHNGLSGKIPASLGKLGGVLFLDLSANNLEGDASMLFGTEKSTMEINLSRNKLRFDVAKVKFGANISNLDLKYNQIYGRLPEGLAELQHLRRFNVSYNNLCGEIPQGGTGRLKSWFNEYCYSHNKCLCGSPLPNCNS